MRTRAAAEGGCTVVGPERSFGPSRLGYVFSPGGLLAHVRAPFGRRGPRPKGAPTVVVGVALVLAGAALLLGALGTAAQAAPPAGRSIASLKTVPVPVPPNLGDFLTDPTPGSPSMVAATQLGKALFWDMQVGSDGIQACASCHFSAGADDRSTNQVSPGLLATPPDTTFQIGGPNATLTASEFPLHQLVNPNNAQSAVVRDANDIVGSQGVFRRDFVAAQRPLPDTCNGGAATLRQVVDFYNRGGDFGQVNEDNLDLNIVPLGLSEVQKNQLV